MSWLRPRAVLLLALINAAPACGESPTQPTGPPPPPAGPAAPQDLRLTVSGPTQSLAFSAQLTWNPPASGPAPTGYQVEFATNATFTTFSATRAAGTSASFNFTAPFRRHSWRVRALDAATEGPASNVVTYVFALPPPQSTLPAPAPLSPSDRTIFDLFPRVTTLTWSAVPGATAYGFEVDYCPTANPWCADELQTEINLTSSHPIVQAPYTSTSLTFNFVGAQPGRWTVWAIDADGRMGARSPWQSFVHLR